jgi:hypothetical protein
MKNDVITKRFMILGNHPKYLNKLCIEITIYNKKIPFKV